jgi:lipoate-protein ligase A
MAADGVEIVRRPTGGRAVLHWRELTYAVVVPGRALGGARATYRIVHETLARALAALGVQVVHATPRGRALPPDAGPCFGAPAAGELVAGGRKLVGSAQARIGGALLQHGSILIEDDQAFLGEVATGARPTTLTEQLGRAPATGDLEERLATAFGDLFGTPSDRSEESPSDRRVEKELESLYRSAGWTWRR